MSGLFGLLFARAPARSTLFLDSLFEEGVTGPSIPPDILPLVENTKEEVGIVDDPGVDITKAKFPTWGGVLQTDASHHRQKELVMAQRIWMLIDCWDLPSNGDGIDAL